MSLHHPLSLRGQVVIVTGASSGIGRATARAFAAQGANVVLAARRGRLLQELADELRVYPVSTLVVPTDLTDDASLEQLVVETRQAFSRIDVLINNAGLGYGGALADMPPDYLHELLRVNLHGTFRLTQLALPIMLEQGSGHIVNVSSFAASCFVPGMGVYSATKMGIKVFSDCLRRELAGSGVSVSTVLAGITRTPMIADAMDTFFSGGSSRPTVLRLLSRVIYTPEATAQVIVETTRRRRRQVLMGGLPIALFAALEATWPRLLDFAFSRTDVRMITSVTQKLGAQGPMFDGTS